MGTDFRDAGHLPKLRSGGQAADPYDLPRQRRGHTPQMHGRYPDYDILEQAAQRADAASFAAADGEVQRGIVSDFADGKLDGGAWEQLSVSHAFSLVMRVVLSSFYSHPWAWNEIGFGGPAYPRGYSRFGSPDLQRAERETWEGAEHFDRDPVSGEPEPPPQ